MAEYIDREALHLAFDEFYFTNKKSLREVIDFVPAADAVEVVRCKDCNKRRTTECRFGITVFDAPKDNDFCSRGEKNG